jgi:hypothetical protein
MITLARSRFRDKRPDLLLLQEFEDFCATHSKWKLVNGPILFPPAKISTRLYTFLYTVSRPVLGSIRRSGAILSLGFPYRHYLFGKTFPYFDFSYETRALWTYDVWEPGFDTFERLVREAKINLLMLSSFQAAQHFRRRRIPDCEVHWVPESIDPSRYLANPWSERTIDILAFGRPHLPYHARIAAECRRRRINYVFQPKYPTFQDLVHGLADAKLCVCFPRSVTHPESAGTVSTLTLRYLEAMASRCLLIGDPPAEARKLLRYNPVVAVDWSDPAGQIESLLRDADVYQPLIEKNFTEVNGRFHSRRFIARVERLVARRVRRVSMVRGQRHCTSRV